MSERQMIEVEAIEEVQKRGVFRYSVRGLGVEGRSRQPLLGCLPAN